MSDSNNQLSFRISTGLKNIIGRDLISDKYIAVFELVKNSYDARATKVSIEFVKSDGGNDNNIISDNGSGMSYDDIINKWLFVAYSDKKKQNRAETDYRDNIRREAAGAKGVGRFSCDRLGASLQLLTKAKDEKATHVVDVNWNDFEYDDTREFMEVSVNYSAIYNLSGDFNNGTIIIVSNLRESWDREDILKLKHSLMKLISPDANLGEVPFDIEIIAKHELENDEKAYTKKNFNIDRDIVNGLIRNDVFEKLNLKTTNISVTISADGKEIISKLFDRGQYIFTIKERNREYALLRDIQISLFYLNKSAKASFTRQMGGVRPVNYGSVFIYKNGFRINPYGETGQDFFDINRRKAQGHSRFLGTREIMGRISIKGDNDQFIETSSRAHGFITTPAVEMLTTFFLERVLKVLEKYVVNIISWGEPLKSDPSHVIEPNEVGEQIISQFISSANPKDIISIDYNHELLQSTRSFSQPDSIKSSLKKLELLAEKTQDIGLINLAKSVKSRTEKVLGHNVELEKENIEKEKELEKEKKKGAARERQIYFLKGAANQDVENLINGFHTIYTLTDAIKGNIDYLKDLLNKDELTKNELILEILGDILQSNDKAHKLADLAIHGNQSLKQSGNNSVNDFLQQYIDSGLAIKGLTYKIIANDKAYNCEFDTSSIGVILDNIATNSIKAGATNLEITINDKQDYVEVAFSDNGIGLSENFDIDMLFEWGVSTNAKNKGFGIGLYHIKMLVTDMHGKVKIDKTYKNGFRLVVALKK